MKHRHPDLLKSIGQNLVVALIFLLMLFAWEEGVRVFEIKRYILPPPTELYRTFIDPEVYPWLLHHTGETVKTVLIGFALALGLGVILAAGMYFSRIINRLMQPLIVISQTVPTIITAPILLIWVGQNLSTKVIATVLNAFFPVVVALYDGLRSPEREQIEMLEAAGASRMQIFTKLCMPAAMPMLFAGLKVASIRALTGAIAGEYVVGKGGLGYYARAMAGQLEMGEVFASVILVSVVGVISYLTVVALERIVMPWYFVSKQND